jgi:hypothetical protein
MQHVCVYVNKTKSFLFVPIEAQNIPIGERENKSLRVTNCFVVKLKWTREEGLSGISFVQFLDLPANPTKLQFFQTEFGNSKGDSSLFSREFCFGTLGALTSKMNSLFTHLSLFFEIDLSRFVFVSLYRVTIEYLWFVFESS